MIHHVSVGTNDLARSIAFYDAVLPRLGLLRMMNDRDEAFLFDPEGNKVEAVTYAA